MNRQRRTRIGQTKAFAPLMPLWCLALVTSGSDVLAETSEGVELKLQATYVQQFKGPFRSPYAGAHSISGDREASDSLTVTGAGHLRLGRNTDLLADVEAAKGDPLSGLTGLGGFTNGEMARSSGPHLRAYLARLYLRQTWFDEGSAGRPELPPAAGAGRPASSLPTHRWVLSAGLMAVPDLFDANALSHDPRSQFLNWTLISQGAYDFAADARGYSRGVVLERFMGPWVWRIGRFLQPREPNQQALDGQITRHYGDQVELERAMDWAGWPGRMRVLLFRNRARMAAYADALALGAEGEPPATLDAVRGRERIKQGVGIGLEQALPGQWGAFARASAADGKTETYAFTEVDRSLSAGIAGPSPIPSRTDDGVGCAWVRNELSAGHRHYLARGGEGFFLGDGRLSYRPEWILEAYYRWSLGGANHLSLDWQWIANPGFNADRGPIRLWSLRWHAEY